MQSEEEYKKWIRVFYEGTLFIKGWNKRKKEILSRIPDDKRDEIEKMLDELGDMIAKEWAKDNLIRKIDTNDIIRWGDRISSSLGKGYEAFYKELETIKEEVLNKLGQ